MSGQEMIHVQQLAELMRGHAELCAGYGAEYWALSYLRRHRHAVTDVELREAGEALRDVLAALAIVRGEQ